MQCTLYSVLWNLRTPAPFTSLLPLPPGHWDLVKTTNTWVANCKPIRSKPTASWMSRFEYRSPQHRKGIRRTEGAIHPSKVASAYQKKEGTTHVRILWGTRTAARGRGGRRGRSGRGGLEWMDSSGRRAVRISAPGTLKPFGTHPLHILQ